MTESDAYRNWTPAAQQAALERLRRAQNDTWRPFYCRVPTCDGKPHDDWKWNHARADQRPPTDDEWFLWLLMSGRGAGKTRTGAEFTQRMTEVTGRIAIVAATGADVRDTCLEGESGILTIARPGFRPDYQPSKRRLTWPNGCVGTTFSAEEPDRLRGPEHGFAWIDEPAHWPLVQEAWDNLLMGLRIGRRPRVIASSTPKPRQWVKDQVADPRTRVSKASTYANLDNLAPTFAERVIKRYEGTRLGRQELHGELLEDVEGALWNWDMIEPHRVAALPEGGRIVVGVDPAGTAKRTSDETGIIVCARVGDDYYVAGDRSGRFSPLGWARAVDAAYDDWSADAVVPEVTYGQDMVIHTLRSADVSNKRIIPVHSRRGKAIRAEPVVGLYEQGRVHHVGVLPELEAELTEWQPYESTDSPNRLDAMVHAITLLSRRASRVDVAMPSGLRDELAARRRIGRIA